MFGRKPNIHYIKTFGVLALHLPCAPKIKFATNTIIRFVFRDEESVIGCKVYLLDELTRKFVADVQVNESIIYISARERFDDDWSLMDDRDIEESGDEGGDTRSGVEELVRSVATQECVANYAGDVVPELARSIGAGDIVTNSVASRSPLHHGQHLLHAVPRLCYQYRVISEDDAAPPWGSGSNDEFGLPKSHRTTKSFSATRRTCSTTDPMAARKSSVSAGVQRKHL